MTTQFIIRFGGLVPGYLTVHNNLNCQPSDAAKYDSIEAAKLAFSNYCYNGNRGVSIRDFQTGAFVQSLN
jgi:hypothetical protein